MLHTRTYCRWVIYAPANYNLRTTDTNMKDVQYRMAIYRFRTKFISEDCFKALKS